MTTSLHFVAPALDQPVRSLSEAKQACSTVLGLEADRLEFYKLVPCTSDEDFKSPVCVRIRGSDLSLASVEKLIEQRDSLTQQLTRSRESLEVLSKEIKKVKQQSSSMNSKEREKNQQRKNKLKQLDEDNKKLRKLLKTQLENSENLRLETQNTVETLRAEFDSLVKELVTFKSREGNQGEEDKADISTGGKSETSIQSTGSKGSFDTGNGSQPRNSENNLSLSNNGSNSSNHQVSGQGGRPKVTIPKMNLQKRQESKLREPKKCSEGRRCQYLHAHTHEDTNQGGERQVSYTNIPQQQREAFDHPHDGKEIRATMLRRMIDHGRGDGGTDRLNFIPPPSTTVTIDW